MKYSKLILAGMASCLGLTACMDDKYDLSDIDTTAKFQVNDLTIPVSIDEITLKSMFDLDESDPDAAVKVINGEYAVVRTGTFGSSEVKIDPIHLRGTAGNPSRSTIQTGFSGVPPTGFETRVSLTSSPVDFDYACGSVPSEILAIESVTGAFDLSLTLDISELGVVLKNTVIKDLVVSVPKGLTGVPSEGTFDAANGTVTVSEAKVVNGVYRLVLKCTAIDFAKAGGQFTPSTHYAALHGSVSVLSGEMLVKGSDVSGSLPPSFTLHSALQLSDIDVESFTGDMRYDITGVNISDVLLNDLPDILTQKETRISLMNPQIYLGVDNPLSPYGLQARTGLSITSNFDDAPSHTASLDAPGYFDVKSLAHSVYVLSPSEPATFQPDKEFHVPFTALSTVLEGDGLPASLKITLDEPNIFRQHVNELPIGVSLGEVSGTYDFIAPLAFGAGSQVVYTDTQDGWNDEDVDAITIETLRVTTTVSSNLPFSLDFTGYPIDVEGKRINNVSITGANIPANASGQEVVIEITGEVTHLDGIVFTATGKVPGNMSNALTPGQGITCSDIRATVSGYYVKEL